MTCIGLWLLSPTYPPLPLSGLHPPWATECHQQSAVAPSLKEASGCQLLCWGLFPHFSWKFFSSLAYVPPPPHLKCFLLACSFTSLNPTGPTQILSPSWNPFWSFSGSGNCSLWWTPGHMVLMLLDILDILLIIFSPLFVCLLCFSKNNVLSFCKICSILFHMAIFFKYLVIWKRSI